MIFGREPALWMALVQTIIALVLGFGVRLSGEQVGLIMAFVAAAFSVVVRQNVTPNVKLNGAASAAVKLLLAGTVAAALLGGSYVPARAQAFADSTGLLKRAALGLRLDGMQYQWDNNLPPASVGVAPGAYASYSLTSELSLAANASRDWGIDLNTVTLGGRALVAQFGTEDRVQLGVMADRVWYSGPGAVAYVLHRSWRFGAVASAVVVHTKQDRDLVYVNVGYLRDAQNRAKPVFLALKLNLVGGS